MNRRSFLKRATAFPLMTSIWPSLLASACAEASPDGDPASRVHDGAQESGTRRGLLCGGKQLLTAEWQKSYWGPHYPKLFSIKKKYDPAGLFFTHHGVGSEEWSADGFARPARRSG
jgi:hypothetical protein